MGIEKSLRGMNDLDHARYLDEKKVVPTHEDIPTLACPINAINMEIGVAQQVSVFYHANPVQTDTMYYSGYPNQMDGDPLPPHTTSGESSAK